MENVTPAAEVAYPINVDCAIHGPWVVHNRFQHKFGGCPKCRQEQQEEENRERLIAQQEGMVVEAGVDRRFRGKTLDTYQIKCPAQQKVLSDVRDYAQNFAVHDKAGRCLTLIGPTGTGKTMLANAVIQFLIDIRFSTGDKDHFGRTYRTKYTTAAEMIRAIRDAWGTKATDHYGNRITATSVMEGFAGFDLLVIDEIGAEGGTGSEVSEVIDMRYREVRPTIIISNCDPVEFKRTLGERAYSRLCENDGLLLPCNWPDWRMRNGKGN